jgi:hypothetical protein
METCWHVGGRILAAVGAPLAAIGTVLLVIGATESGVFLAFLLPGWALLFAGLALLAPRWEMSFARAIAYGTLAALWSTLGWPLGVIMLLGRECDSDAYATTGGSHVWAWLLPIAGFMTYVALSVFVLRSPRRLPLWILAPLAAAAWLAPLVWMGNNACLDL